MTNFLNKPKTFIEHRRSIKAKMNATKGNLVILKKSSLVNKEEKEAIQFIIDAYSNFNDIYNNWRDKKLTKGLKA